MLASGLSILFIATMIGTLAARAWLMASTVCGMTPSSAATTRTTMSVTLAPRARIAVKAARQQAGARSVLLPRLPSRRLLRAAFALFALGSDLGLGLGAAPFLPFARTCVDQGAA